MNIRKRFVSRILECLKAVQQRGRADICYIDSLESTNDRWTGGGCPAARESIGESSTPQVYGTCIRARSQRVESARGHRQKEREREREYKREKERERIQKSTRIFPSLFGGTRVPRIGCKSSRTPLYSLFPPKIMV